MKLNEEQILHLLDLLEADTVLYLMNHRSVDVLSGSQKTQNILFNKEIMKQLKKGLKWLMQTNQH